MKKRSFIIAIIGLILIGISLSLATFIVPSNIVSPNDLSMATLFESMFNEITNEITILSDDSVRILYDPSLSDVSLLWGIQITDYVSQDRLSINISNIFGDDYGTFVMSDPILFEALELVSSDTLNFEIKNIGSRSVSVVMMFSEDPKNSDALSNSDSPIMNMMVLLLISGLLLVLGIIISIMGTILILIDLKNNLDDKRNY